MWRLFMSVGFPSETSENKLDKHAQKRPLSSAAVVGISLSSVKGCRPPAAHWPLGSPRRLVDRAAELRKQTSKFCSEQLARTTSKPHKQASARETTCRGCCCSTWASVALSCSAQCCPSCTCAASSSAACESSSCMRRCCQSTLMHDFIKTKVSWLVSLTYLLRLYLGSCGVYSSTEHRLDAALRYNPLSTTCCLRLCVDVCLTRWLVYRVLLSLLCREAEEGFNRCKLCGFENFKRFPFCNVCGQAIAPVGQTEGEGGSASERTRQWKPLDKKKQRKSVADAVVREAVHVARIAATQRQQRAR